MFKEAVKKAMGAKNQSYVKKVTQKNYVTPSITMIRGHIVSS